MSSDTLHDIHTASLSDVGMVRTHNEDCCDEFCNSNGCHLLVMADGMGGHQGGATASRTAVETIGEVFERSDESCRAMLHEAVITANRRVYGKAIENDALRGMGTTVVALVLAGDGSGWIAHVGDSRGYRLRQGKIEALTADHSVVGEMLQQGLLTRDEAALHPRRNEITRSVGVEAEVEPEISEISVQRGDRFLLCSDGLTGLLDEEEIALVLVGEPPSEAVRILVDEANARGGHDNITVQIAAIGGDEPAAAEPQVTEPRGGADAATSNDGKAAHAEERRRRARRIAALAAMVAGLLAAALLALLFTSTVRVEPQTRGKALGGLESEREVTADGEDQR